jgi:hypothetical protein
VGVSTSSVKNTVNKSKTSLFSAKLLRRYIFGRDEVKLTQFLPEKRRHMQDAFFIVMKFICYEIKLFCISIAVHFMPRGNLVPIRADGCGIKIDAISIE